MATATGWDEGETFHSNQDPTGETVRVRQEGFNPAREKRRFREFIRNYREASNQVFPYRVQLLEQYRRGDNKLTVNLEHLNNYDEELLDLLLNFPKRSIEVFQDAAKAALKQTMPGHGDNQVQDKDLPNIQVLLSSQQTPTPLREICAQDVDKLLLVPGIVTSANRSSYTMTHYVGICAKCKTKVRGEGSSFTKLLTAECLSEGCDGTASFVEQPDESTFMDQQFLKVQEAPEDVPTGELPRSVLVLVDRALVDVVSPGTRVRIMGILTVADRGDGKKGSSTVKSSFLRAVGIQTVDHDSADSANTFTPEEEEKFHELSRKHDIYDLLTRSIAPGISGDYTLDIKRAIACVLFGGTRRLLPDGMKLRGDINVLLIGDPSTAKSQFLKFVEKVSPIGVYTSGKGSSAAGLTASVVKDRRGEYYLEGGAMVLADGGVVCIDEFDKMHDQDRVAIHEAMEQQTISIAKAGITTILNSRSSVLAAANPVHGTYDDLKSAAENIDFLPTILSRFDMIFIVRDFRDPIKDRNIARHVIGIHIDASTSAGSFDAHMNEEEQVDIDLKTMRRYIKYCRAKCAPVLSAEATDLLRNTYVTFREEEKRRRNEFSSGGNSTVPLTVRQLEAMIRVTESLAKMELTTEANTDHVLEAIRLFKVSTLNAANTCTVPGDMSALTQVQRDNVEAAIKAVLDMLHVGDTTEQKKIYDRLIFARGFDDFVARKAIQVMVSRNQISHASQQKIIKRLK